MAVTLYSGLPGTGKTASATFLAVKKYRKENTFIHNILFSLHYIGEHYSYVKQPKKLFSNIKNYIKCFIFDFVFLYQYRNDNPYINVYSNYPILLDPKKNIYSIMFNPLDDMMMTVQFKPGALIIADEIQRIYGSRQFKNFPKEVGTFLQHHRHGGISDIVLTSQHPDRFDTILRELCEVYRKYRIFFKFPFIPLILCTYTNYYEPANYGAYNQVKKEFKTYDYDNHIQLLNSKKIFDRYDSKYFRIIFENLEHKKAEQFKTKTIALDDIKKLGIHL